MIKLHGKVFKYAGPPGTGKSTTLLGVVEGLLAAGIAPEDIVYTTFTRAGAYEARDRACVRFGFSPARLPYFRTLHSLCYQELGKVEVMTPGDWCALARLLGLSFTLRWGPEEGIPRGRTKGDNLLSLWSLARVRMESLEKVYKDRDLHSLPTPDLSLLELEHFVATVQKYKQDFGKIDYGDMLEQFLVNPAPSLCDYIIVDEAQDLSVLQWKVVQKLCHEATIQVHIAGDDDQCIHEWNGAAPSLFIDLESDHYAVLGQSYRIPKSVHQLANTIITQVPSRLPKAYDSRDEAGKIERIEDLSQLDMSQGSWLCLARNKIYLDDIAKGIEEKGLMYSGHEDKDLTDVLRAINTWVMLNLQQKVAHDSAVNMYRFMSQRDRVIRGNKTKLENSDKSKVLSIEDLRTQYGLVAQGYWPMALDMIPEEQRLHLEAVEKREGLAEKPRIELSTIHGAKGREADHVLICPDMTFRTWDAYQTTPDPEHRVWYVGVTRARKSLHILQPRTENYYPL